MTLLSVDSLALSEDEDIEAILSGFDDESREEGTREAAKVKQAPVPPPITKKSWSGFTQTGLSWNYAHKAPEKSVLSGQAATDFRGLSKLDQRFYLEWQVPLGESGKLFVSGSGFYDAVYSIHGRKEYTQRLLDKQESGAELKQAWIQGALGPDLDIKLGRQIVVWGKSDNLRVVDVLNPLDFREPGMVDLEDLRLPVTMTRLDYYRGAWNVSLIATHEARLNKLPPFGSEFFPFPFPRPEENRPSAEEYALSVGARFPGWDISFHHARFNDDQAHLTSGRLEHSRLEISGIAADWVFGSWVFKGELARLDGLQFSNTGEERFSRTDAMLGLEYSGFRNVRVSMEVAGRHLHDFDPLLGLALDRQRENQSQTALRYQQDFRRETVHLLFVAVAWGPGDQGGGFQRLELKVDLADALSVTAGVLNFRAGDHPVFGGYDDNDRLFFKLRYSF